MVAVIILISSLVAAALLTTIVTLEIVKPRVSNATAPTATAQQAAPRPNFVFMLADDLGVNMVDTPQGRRAGLYDGRAASVKSPQAYRLAAEGMFAVRHVASTPVCSPSRYAFMTGIPAGSKWSRVRGNTGIGLDHRLDNVGEISFAEELKRRGYSTAVFGKYHFETAPSNNGWDYALHMVRYYDDTPFPRYFPEVILEDTGNGNVERRDLTPKNNVLNINTYAKEVTLCTERGDRCEYAPDIYHNHSMSWMEQQIAEEKPFFCFLPVLAVHDGRYSSELRYTTMPVPRSDGPIEDYNDAAYDGYFNRMRYLASTMTNYLDVRIGEILTMLETQGVSENTLFIFTSDNGATSIIADTEVGKERILTRSDGFLANHPYRGEKRNLFFGGLAVPTIFHWPGTIAADSTLDIPTDMTDLTATILDFAGVPDVNPQFRGLSLADLLTGATTTLEPAREFIYNEICLDDLGILGQHANCDFAVTFVSGAYSGYKVEWTRRIDNDDTIRSFGLGYTSRGEGMFGNLTVDQLRFNGFVPRVWGFADDLGESLNLASPGRINAFIQQAIVRAEEIVLEYRVVPTSAEISAKQQQSR